MQVKSFQEEVCWMGTMGFQGGGEIGAFSSIPSPKQHLYNDSNVLVLCLFLCGIRYCSHSGSGFGWSTQSTPSLTPAWGIILHHTSLKHRDYQSPMSTPSLTPAWGNILHHTSLKTRYLSKSHDGNPYWSHQHFMEFWATGILSFGSSLQSCTDRGPTGRIRGCGFCHEMQLRILCANVRYTKAFF